MPRAYIDTIFSSKPGKRRWYLAISCGSKVARRSRGISRSILPVSVSTRLAAIAVAAVAGFTLLIEMMVHLGIQRPLGERLLQLVEQAILGKGGLGISARPAADRAGGRDIRGSLRRAMRCLLPDHRNGPTRNS